VSEEVMGVLRSGGFRFQQISIDEAFLDLSTMGEYPVAEEYARGLKARILERTGLTCSTGVAPSRLVAKIASDFKKPDGLTVITPEQVREFLAPMPVRKIPGIGRKAELSLFEAGIRTVADLQGYGLQALVTRFGRHAVRLHEAAFGIDRDPVMEQDGVKSISRETTFETDIADPDALAAAMESLVRDVHRNLAGEGFRFRTVTVKVRYSGFVTRTRATSLSHPSDEIGKIRQAARALLGGMCDGRTVRLLGLRLSGLGQEDAGQTRLPLVC
jgi:DNA polymerase IV (DinB-like DNA polymerase)